MPPFPEQLLFRKHYPAGMEQRTPTGGFASGGFRNPELRKEDFMVFGITVILMAGVNLLIDELTIHCNRGLI